MRNSGDSKIQGQIYNKSDRVWVNINTENLFLHMYCL